MVRFSNSGVEKEKKAGKKDEKKSNKSKTNNKLRVKMGRVFRKGCMVRHRPRRGVFAHGRHC